MTTHAYHFHVGVNVRWWGTCTVSAPSLKAAIDELVEVRCEDQELVVFSVARNGGKDHQCEIYNLETMVDREVESNIRRPYVEALQAIVDAHDADKDPNELEDAIDAAYKLLKGLDK